MSENLPHRAATPAPPMQALDWTGDLPARLSATFAEIPFIFKSYSGQNFIVVPAPSIAEVLIYLRDQENFGMLTDLTAVDYPQDSERFEIVYELYSFEHNIRVRLKTRVNETGEVPSATAVFRAANWLEREVFDMFGLCFAGHPNLKRILMPDEWTGYPLRKDQSITAMDNEWVQANLGIESGH